MNSENLYVEGELYLKLETIAEVYQVQVTWLQEAFEIGLLGSGLPSGRSICIAAVQLDRVATIVRLHDALGLDLQAILISLDDD